MDTHPPTLEDLLERMSAGDEQALSSVYDRTARRVYGLAVALLTDRGAAEEVTLDIYTDAWRRAASFDRTRGSATTWLLTLARSVCLDRLRVRRREASRNQPIDEETTRIGSTDSGPVERSARRDDGVRLRRALSSLPVPQRRALEIAYFGGMSYSETAAALSLPEGTVKARIRAALSNLRRLLGGPTEIGS